MPNSLTPDQDNTLAVLNDRWGVARWDVDADGVAHIKLDDDDKTTIEPNGSCPLIA